MRFSLRTLLIVVLVAGLGLAWIASQYRIVAERRTIRNALEGDEAAFYHGVPGERCERYIEGDKLRRPSQFRLWLGDETVDSILFHDIEAPKRDAVHAFPEADIYFWDF
jgi:hypothetical protein